jgi:adenylyl cyclase-associated protein
MAVTFVLAVASIHLQGTGVTSGLRKVTDDMKAKNRTDRSGHVTTTPAAPKPAAKAAPAAGARGPPRCVIMGIARLLRLWCRTGASTHLCT